MGIVDSTRTVVVKYDYNEWGEILSTTGTLANTIGQINPFRYRSYYYDSRFINADKPENLFENEDSVLQYNIFTYCGNNPIMNSDPSGELFGIIFGVALVIKVVVSVVVVATVVYLTSTPEFQRAFTGLIQTICTGVASAGSAVYNKVKGIADSLAKSLQKAIESARTRFKKKNGATERHHIVAKGKTMCQPARTALLACGIDPYTYSERSPNIVRISYELHKCVHNEGYYSISNNLVSTAYAHGKNAKDKTSRVYATLSYLRTMLVTADRILFK